MPGAGPETNNGFRDPAFADNKTQPLHRWVPWVAGFSAQFVQDCLGAFLKHGAPARPLVLDPFAGVGTTLVEAQLQGCDAVGCEINPYAALACRVKLFAGRLNLSAVDAACRDCERSAAAPAGGLCAPAGFRSRIPFFSPHVEAQVLSLLEFIARIPDAGTADLFRVAFGAVMVSFSNYTYEPSLGSRPGAGKPLVEDADVRAVVLAKVRQMAGDARWLQQERASGRRVGEGRVHHVDFMASEAVLPAESVHLAVTSPPYMNNYHYVRNTRPQLYWLSLVASAGDLKALEQANVGKYWQTVRTAAPVPLAFEHAGLAGFLEELRRTRSEKGAYGGPGWANYVAAYFNDCHRFLRRLQAVLRPGGTGVIVIGNSIIQGHEVKTEQVLAEMAAQQGLAVAGIERVRSKRVGASITQSAVRRGEKSPAGLYESAVIVRKAG